MKHINCTSQPNEPLTKLRMAKGRSNTIKLCIWRWQNMTTEKNEAIHREKTEWLKKRVDTRKEMHWRSHTANGGREWEEETKWHRASNIKSNKNNPRHTTIHAQTDERECVVLGHGRGSRFSVTTRNEKQKRRRRRRRKKKTNNVFLGQMNKMYCERGSEVVGSLIMAGQNVQRATA